MIEPRHGGVVVFLVKVDVLGNVAHSINHPLALIKMNTLLTVVGKFDSLTDLKVAAVGLDNIEQQLDKCGLTHTVVTHNTQLLVARKRVVEIVENHLVAIALAHVMGRENLFTDVGTLDIQLHLAVVTALLGPLLQVIEGIDAVLCFVGACLGLPAHPVKFGAQQVASPLHLDILCLDALGAFL